MSSVAEPFPLQFNWMKCTRFHWNQPRLKIGWIEIDTEFHAIMCRAFYAETNQPFMEYFKNLPAQLKRVTQDLELRKRKFETKAFEGMGG